jgi:hypothetical protein
MDTYQKLVRPNPAHDFIFQKISAHGLGLTQPTRTPVLLLVSQLLGSKHLRIRIQPSFALNSGPVPKKVILQLPILHKYNDEGIFMCIPPPPDTFTFIQWRSLSDTASKCFISTPVFPEIGM